MTDLSSGQTAGSAGSLVQNLLQEFLADTADDSLALADAVDQSLDQEKLQRFALHVRGQAQNLGAPLLQVVAHRMGEYLEAMDPAAPQCAKDLRTYLDAIHDIAEGDLDDGGDPQGYLRQLPARPTSFDVSSVEIRNVEVMLVMEQSAQTHFVERELQQCGYRVSIVPSTIAALQLALATKPEMVIISAVMPMLSGIDLAIALSSMTETRNLPIALITSLPSDHEHLRLIPDRVPIIRKGSRFGDDLADALAFHFLL